ncbi:MAG TPA: SDR family oxidoreductase [Candidatus Binatia bacterium]|jgi:NAD(P)-dependent dehydrogenase (short-subunit alcohol dehydrogenase family)|nr:SDR family oxidoreductase [Candidatus Binatia bacterium]
MSNMEGKAAIVTGASSGIGLQTALAFAGNGARVVVADVDEQAGQKAVETIEECNGKAIFARTDVSESAQVQALVKKSIEHFGRLDYAVNNAGIGGESVPTAQISEEGWQGVIDINLTGVWLCMKYEIPALLDGGGGAIVNVASILGKVGFANAAAYVSAKHGVLGLTKTAAMEYATQGIRINAVCPAFIYTPMLEKTGMTEGSDMYNYISSRHPMQRMGTAQEVANMIVWACSDEASFVTGTALMVDGGYIAQ